MTLIYLSRKWKCLSLKKSDKKVLVEHLDNNRFAVPTKTEEVDKATKELVPVNTETSTRWAVNNFMDWAIKWNKLSSNNPVPLDLLECHDADGGAYQPCTIRALLSGLNHVLHINKAPFFILDKHNPECQELSNTLNVLCSNLHRKGIGSEKHSAPVVRPEDELLFWEKDLLGYGSPRSLQRTVFFYVGLHFTLHGVQQQHDLVARQFSRVPPQTSIYDGYVYYQYTEYISKNNQHWFKDLNSSSKVVRAYAHADLQHCVVKVLDACILQNSILKVHISTCAHWN